MLMGLQHPEAKRLNTQSMTCNSYQEGMHQQQFLWYLNIKADGVMRLNSFKDFFSRVMMRTIVRMHQVVQHIGDNAYQFSDNDV